VPPPHEGRGLDRASVERNPLLAACEVGCVSTVDKLLALGRGCDDLDLANMSSPRDRVSPTIVAAMHGHADVLDSLLANPACAAQVNSKDRHGHSALFKAAARGHLEAVRVLLRAGAAPLDAAAGRNCTKRLARTSPNTARRVEELLKVLAAQNDAEQVKLAVEHQHLCGVDAESMPPGGTRWAVAQEAVTLAYPQDARDKDRDTPAATADSAQDGAASKSTDKATEGNTLLRRELQGRLLRLMVDKSTALLAGVGSSSGVLAEVELSVTAAAPSDSAASNPASGKLVAQPIVVSVPAAVLNRGAGPVWKPAAEVEFDSALPRVRMRDCAEWRIVSHPSLVQLQPSVLLETGARVTVATKPVSKRSKGVRGTVTAAVWAHGLPVYTVAPDNSSTPLEEVRFDVRKVQRPQRQKKSRRGRGRRA